MSKCPYNLNTTSHTNMFPISIWCEGSAWEEDDGGGWCKTAWASVCWFADLAISHRLLNLKASTRTELPHITTPHPAKVASRIDKTGWILICIYIASKLDVLMDYI